MKLLPFWSSVLLAAPLACAIDEPLRFEPSAASANVFQTATREYSALISADATVILPGGRDRQDQVTMRLRGADPNAGAITAGQLPGVHHYLVGKDRRRWRTHVPGFSSVTFRNVYPGIDVTHYGRSGQLEYDFVVRPGSDTDRIVLHFAGQRGLRIDESGALVLETSGGKIRHHKPVAWQEAGGSRTEVAVRFVRTGPDEVKLQPGAYDARRELYIDPVVDFSTYLGADGAENPTDITLDLQGNIYVTGPTNSANFPLVNPLQPELRGGLFDCFVSKFSPDGSRLIYSTFIGGSSTDDCRGVAVDRMGNAYIAGQTLSPDLPVVNAVQPQMRGQADGMLAKISADGSRLLFLTYIGGSGGESGNRVKLDIRGNVYLAGETSSTDFPVASPLQASFGGGSFDAYVVKLDGDGQRIVYGTYLGGSGTDYALGLAVDLLGRVHLTGQTESADFPTERPIQPALKMFSDVYVAKIRADGQQLVFSTYLGGSGSELAPGIVLDVVGNIYVAGRTSSPDFPVKNAFQPVGKGFDAFVTKLRPDGSEIVYSTYFGGGGQDEGLEVAVDWRGHAYLTGQTRSPDLPVVNAIQGQYGGGTSDAFVAKFAPEGNRLLFSTYLGGQGSEEGRAVAASPAGRVFATGVTASPDFPVRNAFQPNYSGFFNDGFVIAINTED